MKRFFHSLLTVCSVCLLLAVPGLLCADESPITDSHITEINDLFKKNNITRGFAALDQYRRIVLKGEYADEREVDVAFSLAQTAVGIKWVSPVTPENIKVKEWEKRLGGLFSRAAVLKATAPEGAPGPVRNKYALIVGVGQFKNGITSLQYSVRDAGSFYNFLVDPKKAAFPKSNTYFLVDQNATRDNIARYLEGIKNVAGPDDLVVVYMSSHGTPPDKFGGVHVVTYDTDVKPREKVWHTAITESMLKDFVENLKAKRLVMILDTCYSNGAYRAVPGFLPAGGKSLGVVEEDEGYGVSKEYGKRVLGSKDIVLEDEPKPKASSAAKGTDSHDGYGKVLISASSAGEKSWESDTLRNSVFTYYFVDGLGRYQGSVKDAFTYAKPLVGQKVKQEKGADITQTPQAMSTNTDWNMRVIQKR